MCAAGNGLRQSSPVMTQLSLEGNIAAVRRFCRFFSQRLGALGAGPSGSMYSATEVRVLAELAQHEARTVTALSRSLGLDAGYLSRVIRRLETTGIVAEAADSADSRQQPMALTRAGREAVNALDVISAARYAALVRALPSHTLTPVLEAMERIEGAFGADVPARDATPWLLRPHRAGDISAVTQRTIASASEEFGFNGACEVMLLQRASDFVANFEAERDCSWIAERDGVVVGAALVKRDTLQTARLMMLHVESRARGIGIGRRLIAEAINFVTRAGYKTLELGLFDVMKSARFLAHGAGFRHADESAHTLFGQSLQQQTWQLNLR